MANNHDEETELKEENGKSMIESMWPNDLERSFDLAMWGFVPWSRFGFRRHALLGLSGEWLPKVDVFHRDGEIVVRADLPGLDIDDIDVSVDDDRLIIQGHREESEELEDDTFEVLERSSGSFYRAIELPRGALVDSIEAVYENGVLEVTIPMAEYGKHKSRKVAVK